MQCFHCGRAVRETIHTQKNYRVDYYSLHTGNTEWAFFVNPNEHVLPLRYLKLTHPADIVTCIECHARGEIRQRLDEDFHGRRPLLEPAQAEPKAVISTPGADTHGE
jgi:hypothetical protein